jgi:hypothetical protein
MLSPRDARVLEFEREWWRYPGPKDRAIREYLGMSATRYYQILRRLMDDPAASERDPLTIRRLRRIRGDARRKALERLRNQR